MKDLIEGLRASIDTLMEYEGEPIEQVIFKIQEALEVLEPLANPDRTSLVQELYDLADWAQANSYEVPVNLPIVLWSAGATLEYVMRKEK